METIFCIKHGHSGKKFNIKAVIKNDEKYCKKCWDEGPSDFSTSDYNKNTFDYVALQLINKINEISTHIREIKAEIKLLNQS